MADNISFNYTMDLVPGMALLVDDDLRFIKFNLKFAENFFPGFSGDSVPVLNDFFKDHIIRKIKRRFNFNDKNSVPLAFELETVRGRLDAEIYIRRCSEGDERQYFIYIDDVTEKKRFEDDFHNLLNIIDVSPASIVVTDVNGSIEFVNKRFTEITGYSKSEVLGESPRILKSGSQKIDFYKDMWNTILQGREWRGEFHNIKKNGESFWEIASVSPIKNRDGKIQHLIAVKEDITHLKLVEDELKKSEEKNRNILAAIPDVMFSINAEGTCLDGHIASKAEEVFPENIRKTAMPVIMSAVKNLAVEVYEYPVYYDKKLDYYEARFIASDEDEILVIVRNITERVQFEEQIKKARDDAEAANRSKSDFLANMSHEIRTPLNSIMGFIELLQRSGLSKTHSEYLAIVSRSAESLLGIINDILDFSKIESRRIEIEEIEFSPFREFESVIDLFYARAAEKRIDLISYIDPSMPASLMGDPLRIKQVLSNLLSNAVKFTHEGGYILFEVNLVSQNDGRAEIYFGVTDNGIGIPERKRKKIFEAFSQADSSVTRRYGGTGLGLSISTNLVSLMGGSLELISEPGKGSSFFFKLDMGASNEGARKKFDISRKGISGGIFIPSGGGGVQERVIFRYLESFGITPVEVKGSYPPSLSFLIAVESSESKEFISSIRDECHRTVFIRKDNDSIFTDDVNSECVIILNQPVNASNLYDSIIKLSGSEFGYNASESVPDTDGAVIYDASVLVAEDNPVNQKLIKLMLLEFGIKADIASNGLSAFEMARAGRYDLIFMDVNMPVSDGIESTAMILEYEKNNSLSHAPIVALTAKAIKGDREHLLASGMDDYLAKPVSLKSLGDTLQRHLNLKQKKNFSASSNNVLQKTQVSEKAEPSSAGNGEYDFSAAAGVLGISEKILKVIITEFLDTSEETIASAYNAIAQNDMEQLSQSAHKIKGASANLRLAKISSYALEIEISAKNNEALDYKNKIDDIVKEIAALKNILFE